MAWCLLFADGREGLAFGLFAAAALTDLIDGWLARTLNAPSGWGDLLDPLADKMLYSVSWVALGLRGWAPWWLVWPSLLRHAIVAAVWLLSRRRGLEWPASVAGQLTASFEGTALGLLLFHGPFLEVHWPTVGVVTGCIGLALSIGSALGYVLLGPRQPAPQ